MNKILIFPGAFNPPHNGHIGAVEKALRQNSFDEIWIIPSGNREDKEITTDYKDRREMGKLFVEELQGKISIPVKLVSVELDDVQKRGTRVTLEKIKTQSGAEVTQLIGSDAYENISLLEKEKDKFLIIGREINAISSTQIRHMIATGDETYKELIPSLIATYIDTRGLYRK